jgi:hypothetical protein
MDAPFQWDAPDLQEGGEWFEARLDKLRTITEGWRDQNTVIQDARCLLASHRLNYTSQGAQRLEILWWEWPPEKWESLRFGGSMKFMKTPAPILEDNVNMTESQLTIAVAFVTELNGSSGFSPPGCPSYENVSPVFGRQSRTTRQVEMNCRHEERASKQIMCSRTSPHDMP